MPTREEIRLQVENALRARFFRYVPPMDPATAGGMNVEQLEKNRLSRCLAAFALVGIAEIEDFTAAECVTDGQDDHGIDAVYYDRSAARLNIVQAKYTVGVPSQADVLKTIQGVRALVDRRFDEFNERFALRRAEIEDALDTPGVEVVVVLVHLEEALTVHPVADLTAYCTELSNGGGSARYEDVGIVRVHGWLLAEHEVQPVSATLTLEDWSAIEAPRRALIGLVSAAELARVVKEKGKALFEKNIRHYVGSNDVNSAIAATLQAAPGDLFYLNNGMTAVVQGYTRATGGTRAKSRFRFDNISIVNGAQTAGVIVAASTVGAIGPEAKVMMTVIEVGADTEDFRKQITKSRNYQTAVRTVDFAALDEEQERLRQEAMLIGAAYHYRPSEEAAQRRADSFTITEAAIALACLSFPFRTSTDVAIMDGRGQRYTNGVDYVYAAKKEIGMLTNRDEGLYGTLFNANLSGVRMVRLVSIYRILFATLASSEYAESLSARRMFYRHNRYFVMCLAASRIRAIIDRVDHRITIGEKLELSRVILEVAEELYTLTIPDQQYRGYLWMFRNRGPIQELVDRMLAPQPVARVAAPLPATDADLAPGTPAT